MKTIKINNIIRYMMVSLLLLTLACQPIVDEVDFVNAIDESSVELVAEQDSPGGNQITLKMISQGVSGYWDYGLGRAYTDRVTFVSPIPGKKTYTFVGNLGTEYFTKTIDVQIDNLSVESHPDWQDLVGEDIRAGKTWVFKGVPFDNTLWWYMVAPNDPNGWEGAWWNAAGTCCPPFDAAGKMKFDLDDAANYTYTNGGVETKASFLLDTENQTLAITDGSNILGAEEPRGNPSAKYTIISLTEDELILYNPNNAGGTGWTWVFKPE